MENDERKEVREEDIGKSKRKRVNIKYYLMETQNLQNQ